MSSSPASTLPAGTIYPPTAAGIGRLVQLLGDGKLVILPTETVYGIAVNLRSQTAREAAYRLKTPAAPSESAAPSPWVIHTGTPEQLLSWVPHLSPLGKRLIAKALPGPVAFQIRLDADSERAARQRLNGGGTANAADETIRDGTITFRCPDFAATQEILAAVPDPVAIIGAGTPAQPGVFDLSDLPSALFTPSTDAPPHVAGALDGGPTRYRRSSTLVRIDGENYSVLRPGVIDERIIHKMADFTLLFLCSGNTCRSPMAAALAAKILADKLHIAPGELPLRHIVVQSAGLHAAKGIRAAIEAIDTVHEMGADLSAHFSQPATPELLRRADAIYTMTNAHRDEVIHLVPGAERKTFRLDPEGDVADPIGSNLAVYQKVAHRLNTLLQQRLSELSV